ncbi:MAG: LAGLIDADG family homing endonuclease [Patescibacteria group bacterium]|nr:LAGLIDADG family homing endonuclease [Patescibacteria group bacterium]
MPRAKVFIPPEELEQLYWKKYLSPLKIGKLYKCDAVTVRTRMREYGIPKRSSSEARMRYRKYDFSDNLAEKAYMIGFRLGDLNVYQTSALSDLIVARCNTTQEAQINLMKNMFSKYGQVTVSKGKDRVSVNCHLNKSFDFLIPKHKKVPKWIDADDQLIAAFIAGYTDAEGNFILNQKRARFKIDSYDKDIITWMVSRLTNCGILARARCISKRGALAADGSRFKKDLWRINVNQAISLLKFINKIKPFITHKGRMQCMIICEDNIKARIEKGSVKYATI